MPKSKPTPKQETTLAVRDTTEELASATRQFRELDDAVRQHVSNAMESAVASGVYLLKIRELHCQQGRRTDLETSGQVSASAESESEVGFLAYLEQEFCKSSVECDTDEEHRRNVDSSLRRFRRYMNAARFFGLNGDHTLEDVRRLRASGAFASLTLSEIYKPKQLQDTPPEDKDRPRPSVHATISANLSQLCSEILTVKDDCPSDLYEANHTLLKSTLEAYTGAEWVMAGTANHGEHAQLHINGSSPKQKGAKGSKGKKLSAEERRKKIAAEQRKRWARAANKGARK